MNWIRGLFSRRRRYDELSESIREHIDEKVADLMDRGRTREDAERRAHREFGNITRIEERSREVWQGATLALAGIAFGSGMALGLTRFMRTLLFEVSPTDVETFLSVGVVLTIIALAACLIPALRAASVDPIRALRAE